MLVVVPDWGENFSKWFAFRKGTPLVRLWLLLRLSFNRSPLFPPVVPRNMVNIWIDLVLNIHIRLSNIPQGNCSCKSNQVNMMIRNLMSVKCSAWSKSSCKQNVKSLSIFFISAGRKVQYCTSPWVEHQGPSARQRRRKSVTGVFLPCVRVGRTSASWGETEVMWFGHWYASLDMRADP